MARLQIHKAEASRVIIYNACAALEMKDDMIVKSHAAGVMMKCAGALLLCGIDNRKAAAHAEMHDQHFAGRKIDEEIFGPPPEA